MSDDYGEWFRAREVELTVAQEQDDATLAAVAIGRILLDIAASLEEIRKTQQGEA